MAVDGDRSAESERIELVVPAEAAGERLDRWLATTLDRARNQIRGWVDDGRVALRENRTPPLKASFRLSGSETLVLELPSTQPEELAAEAQPLEVVHEDEHFLVVEKPAGLVVHPGAGHVEGTLCHRLIHHYPECRSVGHARRPGIVHRLDRGTSGVMVVARTDLGYRQLTAAFADRQVQKHYVALSFYGRQADHGAIDLPIARHRHDRTRMAVSAEGREAQTSYRVLARSATGRQAVQIAALLVAIATGRTHQIRVHLQAERTPLVGDEVYGEARWKNIRDPTIRRLLSAFPRPALHAWRLAFPAPGQGGVLTFQAGLPDDLGELWSALDGVELSTELLDRTLGELQGTDREP